MRFIQTKVKWVEIWLSIIYILSLCSCSFISPFAGPKKSITQSVSTIQQKMESGMPKTSLTVTNQLQRKTLETLNTAKGAIYEPNLSDAELDIPKEKPMHNVIAEIAPIVSSASAPNVLIDAHRWFYVAVVACIVASVIAGFTTHFLACIKFALAAFVGYAMNWIFGVVIGSFVLSCFASFAIGLIIAWYMLNGKHKFEPSSMEADINARIGELEKRVISK